MIVDKVVANTNDMSKEDVDKRHMEKVYMESPDLMKRIQRVKTDHDREFGIRLAEPKDLKVGDVLFMDDDNMVVVDIHSDDLIVISPRDMNEMGTIAHLLGNRHLPAQFSEDDMLVQYDYLVEELLAEKGIPFERETRKVTEPFRHVGHSHD